MTTTPGQLDFEGREVAGAVFEIGSLKIETLPEGLTWEDVANLKTGDWVEFRIRAAYNRPGAEERVDRENGVATGSLIRKYGFTPFREGFKVEVVIPQAEREAAWRKDHGAA